MAQAEPITLLRQWFSFDDHDLFANREGVISPSQRTRLRREYRDQTLKQGADGIRGLLAALLICGVIPTGNSDVQGVWELIKLTCVVLIGVSAFVGFLHNLKHGGLFLDLHKNQVAVCEGLIAIRPVATFGGEPRCRVSIAGQEFPVDSATQWAFANLPLMCRLYYLPRTRKLLSIEQIEVTG